MKKVSIFGLSFLTVITAITIMLFNACTKDACKDVNCLNGGTCVSGTCDCTVGYEGGDCSTVSRDKFVKLWTSVSNSCIGGQSAGQLTITAGSTVLDMNLSNFGHLVCGAGTIVVAATITASDAFIIPSQVVCGTTYTGSGTISGNQLSISYTYDDPTFGQGSCTDTYN